MRLSFVSAIGITYANIGYNFLRREQSNRDKKRTLEVEAGMRKEKLFLMSIMAVGQWHASLGHEEVVHFLQLLL